MNLVKKDIEEISHSIEIFAGNFSGKRILITGGKGFLGRYFIEVFNELNTSYFPKLGVPPCELIILDNFITSGVDGKKEVTYSNMAFVEHDIIKPFYPERPVDFIIHAAGIASPYYYRMYPEQTLEVATTGLKNTLDIALKNKLCRVLFFSSSEIYGDPTPDKVPTTEDYNGNVSSLGARACYDESKRLGETIVSIYTNKHNVRATIVRPFNVYGPGMQKTDYRVLPNVFSKISSGEKPQIYGDGNQTRTFCYITDAMIGFLQVLVHGRPGEAYNIGNPYPEVSMNELMSHIRTVIGKEIEYDLTGYPDSYPADEPNRRCPDIRKAESHVDYQAKISLGEGLRRFYNWTLDNY